MKVEMNIDDVAKLARLKLSAEEREKFSSQMSDILSYVQKLNAVDTTHVQAADHVEAVQNVTRPDEVKPSLDPDSFLKHAPLGRDQFFIVPQVIE
ncbi:MAG: Asp-tRNA(Asn)/Glu-tRNA(Gln) amidotransferase subunit GatC [Chlamydiae bacterium]|nr:Asp-tRNA(Asn)/Glu-tRNA(Gln) amidotransferase subunit GatC [Chlamydiota bacterium]MBI3265715.1 Asp-tRNA(Asn)/Glu-tRNA(Gln) amidotransferase subunit GatC [Chlamydiota bacterium]